MEPITPNLSSDLIRIHKVITRGINVGIVKGREYLQAGFPLSHALVGYSSYTHCLVSVLDSHHTSEDLIAFPELRRVIPSAPYAKLASDHQKIESLLSPLPTTIAKLSDEAHKGLVSLVDTLRKISEIWEPHIQLEERYFSTANLNAVMTLDDQRKISEASSKYSQEHSEPPYWVVPFVLYNLERDEREVMAASLPPTIMEELVPKVWAEQWAPMKPLLLD
jgi:iron-sulfur cluster repair protein YtfE (RIC family)